MKDFQYHNLKSLAAFGERVQGLIKDGYKVYLSANVDNVEIIKLVHRNGKRITLKYSYNNATYSQFVNGKQVYCSKMC